MSGILTQSQRVTLGARTSAPLVTLVEEEDFAQSGIFRCYADCEAVALSSAVEPVRLLGRNIPETYTEYLEFVFNARATLSRPMVGAADMAWVGRHCGEPSVRRGEVVLPAPALGVLRVTYSTQYSRWRLPTEALRLPRVLVVALCREVLARWTVGDWSSASDDSDTGGAASIPQLSLEQPAPSAEGEAATRYVLTVVDYCTGDPVPGAQVSTTYGKGVADANGQVEIGPVPTGARVELAITAEGYQDTRLDSLNNDYFYA